MVKSFFSFLFKSKKIFTIEPFSYNIHAKVSIFHDFQYGGTNSRWRHVEVISLFFLNQKNIHYWCFFIKYSCKNTIFHDFQYGGTNSRWRCQKNIHF